jgi:hypothetical protein
MLRFILGSLIVGAGCAISAFALVLYGAGLGDVSNYGVEMLSVKASGVGDEPGGEGKVGSEAGVVSVQTVNFKFESPDELFLIPEEESKDIGRLKFYSADGSSRLRGFSLEVGGLVEEDIEKIELEYDGGVVYNGVFEDGVVEFKNLYLNIEPGIPLYFDVHVDFVEGLHFGQSAWLSVRDESFIDLTMGGERIYIDKDYPVVSPSLSVVGGRMVF